jgi:hypothetical protein
MAWSSAALAAYETASALADKPILLASHYLRDNSASGVWESAGVPGLTTAPLAAITRAFDGWANPGNHTKPSTGSGSCSLVFDCGATATGDFDAFVLHMSNPQDAATIAVEISDDDVTYTTVATPTPSSDPRRIIGLDLHHSGSVPLRYSDARYVRLSFTGTNYIPRVREFWLGRRRQLQRLPNAPYAALNTAGDVVYVQTESGIRHAFRRSAGAGTLNVRLELPTVSQLDDVEAAWSECGHGAYPLHWIETPTTEPRAYIMRHASTVPELVLSQSGPTGWRADWPMLEQHPLNRIEQ